METVDVKVLPLLRIVSIKIGHRHPSPHLDLIIIFLAYPLKKVFRKSKYREPLAKLFRNPWSRRVRLVPTRPFLQQKPSALVYSLILRVFRHCLDAPLPLMPFSNDVFRNPGQVASLIS